MSNDYFFFTIMRDANTMLTYSINLNPSHVSSYLIKDSNVTTADIISTPRGKNLTIKKPAATMPKTVCSLKEVEDRPWLILLFIWSTTRLATQLSAVVCDVGNSSYYVYYFGGFSPGMNASRCQYSRMRSYFLSVTGNTAIY